MGRLSGRDHEIYRKRGGSLAAVVVMVCGTWVRGGQCSEVGLIWEGVSIR